MTTIAIFIYHCINHFKIEFDEDDDEKIPIFLFLNDFYKIPEEKLKHATNLLQLQTEIYDPTTVMELASFVAKLLGYKNTEPYIEFRIDYDCGDDLMDLKLIQCYREEKDR